MSIPVPFDKMIGHLPDGLVLLDSNGLILYMNPSAEKMTGTTLKAEFGRHWKDVFSIHMENPAGDETGSLVKILQERPVLVATDGRAIPIQVHIAPLPEMANANVGSMLILHDVTELSQETRALKESRSKYRRLVNTIEGIVWEADANNLRFRFVSDFAEQMLGYPVKKWLRDAGFYMNIIHPEDRDSVQQVIQQSIQNRENYQIEYRMIAASGRTLLVRDSVTLDYEEKELRLIGVMSDITLAKSARDQLIQSEERFSFAFYANPAALLVMDPSGKIQDANESFERLTGYFREDITGRTLITCGFCSSEEYKKLAEHSDTDASILFRPRSGDAKELLVSLRRVAGQGSNILVMFRDPASA